MSKIKELTKTPWSIMRPGGSLSVMIYGVNGERICRMIDNKIADAEFIVEAVNKLMLEKLEERLRELTPRVIMLGHVQGTKDHNDWKCGVCNDKWISTSRMPCENCGTKVENIDRYREATQIVKQLDNLREIVNG